MSCKRLTNTNGAESILFNDLYNITKDESAADELYSYFGSDEFVDIFGNYQDVNQDNIQDFQNRIDDNNEPLLYFNEPLKKYYFLDKENEKVFYPYTKQGLEQFFTANDIKLFAKTLGLKFYENNFKFDIETFEFDRQDTIKLKDFISSYIDSKIDSLNSSDDFNYQMYGYALENSKDNVSQWYDEVITFYNSLKLDVETEEVNEIQDQSENLRGETVRVESFLKDSKSNINENIKLFLSLLPSNEKNNFDEYNFINFDETYNLLNKNLADIIAVQGEVSLEDEFDLYLNNIKKIATKKSEFKELVRKIENAEEIFKNQFVAAFRLGRNIFLTTEFARDKNGNISSKVLNASEVSSLQGSVLDQWLSNFKDLKLTATSLKNVRESFKQSLGKFNKTVNTIKSEKDLIKPIEELANTFRKLGVEVTQEGIDFYLDNLSYEPSTLSDKKESIIRAYSRIVRAMDAYIKDTSINLFKDQSIFKNIAQAEAVFIPEGSDASIFSLGKSKWVYSLPSYLKNKINAWKKDPNLLLKHYESRDYYKGSHWMEYLLALDVEEDNRLETSKTRLGVIELGIFNSVQEENDSVNAVDNKDITYTDAFADYINKLLAFKKGTKEKGAKVWHKTALAGDKNTEYQIYYGNDGDYFNLSANAVWNPSSELVETTDAVVEIFYKYFKSEYDRIRYEHSYFDLNKSQPEKLIPNYHTGNKNAFKSQLFPSLSVNFKDGKTNLPALTYDLYDSNGVPLYEDLDQVKELVKDDIIEFLSNGIRKTYDKLFEYNIVSFDENGVKQNNGIDSQVYNNYISESTKDVAPLKIAADLFVNSVISQVEYSKMFTGDTAFYKDMTDYKKRVPETYTDGQYMRLRSGEEHFNVAVISSVEIPVPYQERLVALVGKKIADKYNDVNAADAQAWITPERWRFIMQRLGKWDKNRANLYKKMMTEEAPIFTNKELKLLGQPLKGVYFDIIDGVPTYLKYSQAVLWPNLIRGTELEKFRTAMGKDIQELITKDGIKVGYNTPVKTHNETGDIKDDFILNNVKQLNNNAWKLQQDLPIKGFKKTDVGSQIQKNIFQGLVYNLDKDFEIDGKSMKGTDVVDYLNELMSELSNRGYQRVIRKLGINPDTFKIENEDEMFGSLVEQLKKRKDVPANLIKALHAGVSPYGIPGSFEMFQNVFSSFVNDNTIKIKTNGGGFIQMADYGLNQKGAQKKGVIFTPWFNTEKLAPPQIEINPETGRKTIIPGGIFISGSLIAKYVPNYKTKTPEQLFGTFNEKLGKYTGGIIDQDILTNIIGYRIPNQGLASNDALQVMGILPDEVGDTIIAYTGITTKTGSDYDIDKMYLMVPSFKPVYKNIKGILKDSGLTEATAKAILRKEGIYNITDTAIEDLFYYLDDLIRFDQPIPEDLKRLVETVKLETQEVSKLIYSRPKGDQTIQEYDLATLQNKLIEAYKSILTSEHTIRDTMTPIDVPYIASDIKNMFPAQVRDDMLDFDALSDLDLKFEFILGKAGLGQNVNSLVDAVRGAMADLKIYQYFIKESVSKDGNTVFDREFSESLSDKDLKEYVESYNLNEPNPDFHISLADLEGLKKIKLFEAMMGLVNGFVDIAKDPFIVRGNWVTQTNNIGFLMLRAGVHPFYVNAFLGQPILKQYIKFVNNMESKIVDNSGDLEVKFKLQKVTESYSESETTSLNDRTFLTRTLFTSAFNYKKLSQLVKSKPENYLKNKIVFISSVEDVILKKFGFKNKKQLDQDLGVKEEFGRIVDDLVTNFDLVFENKNKVDFNDLSLRDLRDEINKETLEVQLSIFDKFVELRDMAKKLTKSVNSAKVDVNGKGKNIMSLITTSNTIQELLDKDTLPEEISGVSTKFLRNGQDTFLNTYTKNSIGRIYNVMRANPKFFLTASNSVISTFNSVSDFIYGETLQNEKLGNKLERAYYTYIMSGFPPLRLTKEEKTELLEKLPEEFKELQKNSTNKLIKKLYLKEGAKRFYIAMSNNKTSVSEKNDLTDAWKDLLEEEPAFANKLIQYSYLISGFSSTVNQFHQFIPYEWFNKNRFNSYLKNVNTIQQEVDINFINQFFKNNYEDKSIIRKVFKAQMTPFEKDGFRTGFIAEEQVGYLVKYDISEPSTGDIISRYFRLYGYNNEGKAIYLRTSLMGSRDRKGNKFTEYDLDPNYSSILNSNGFSNYNKDLMSEYLNDTDITSPFEERNIILASNAESIEEENEIMSQQEEETPETATENAVTLWEENKEVLKESNPDITFDDFIDMIAEMGREYVKEFIKKCKGK